MRWICLSLFLDYEMSTLPKHFSASQGAKLEQEYEVPAEEKTNMWGTLEDPHCSQKGISLWGLLESVDKHNKMK